MKIQKQETNGEKMYHGETGALVGYTYPEKKMTTRRILEELQKEDETKNH